MIILRNKTFSRFDLTPEEQEIWDKSIKRDGKRPSIKELFQQAKKYKKGELSDKELAELPFETCELETCKPETANIGGKKRWGNGSNVKRGAHDDVLRSRIAKKKIGKNLAIGTAAILGTSAIIGGGIAINKARKKKKEK